jgi:hypothetical protein
MRTSCDADVFGEKPSSRLRTNWPGVAGFNSAGRTACWNFVYLFHRNNLLFLNKSKIADKINSTFLLVLRACVLEFGLLSPSIFHSIL